MKSSWTRPRASRASERPVVVCYAVHRLRAGGSITLLRARLALLATSHRERVSVRVCALLPTQPGDPTADLFQEECQRLGIPVTVIGHTGRGGLGRTVRALVREGRRADIVHTVNMPWSYAAVMALLARKRLILEWVSSAPALQLAQRLSASFASANVAVSRAVLDGMPANVRGRVIYPPMPPHAAEVQSPPAELVERTASCRPVVLFVSRLSSGKGVWSWPEVIAAITDRYPSALFLVAGEGEEADSFKAAIARRDLSSRVLHLGHRSDVQSLHALADVYVSTSEHEGLVGYATLEAIRAGTPVTASNIPSVAEILRHGIDVMLCDPSNANTYADAVARIIDDRAFREGLTASAKRRIDERLDPDRSIDELLRVYAEVDSGRRRAALAS